MTSYATPLAVTLTVADWLELQCALSDAYNYNAEHEWHALARGIRTLKDRINDQAGAAMDAAWANMRASVEAAQQHAA